MSKPRVSSGSFRIRINPLVSKFTIEVKHGMFSHWKYLMDPVGRTVEHIPAQSTGEVVKMIKRTVEILNSVKLFDSYEAAMKFVNDSGLSNSYRNIHTDSWRMLFSSTNDILQHHEPEENKTTEERVPIAEVTKMVQAIIDQDRINRK